MRLISMLLMALRPVAQLAGRLPLSAQFRTLKVCRLDKAEKETGSGPAMPVLPSKDRKESFTRAPKPVGMVPPSVLTSVMLSLLGEG